MTKSYEDKKRFFSSIISIFGRKPALEVIEDKSLNIYKLHLADSNKAVGIIQEIEEKAKKRHIEIQYHDRKALSHISKNAKQDQGVVVDIYNPKMRQLEQLEDEVDPQNRFVLLDNITNPQNVGMIIRSVAAANVAGIIIPERGNATLNALVIKSSAGTLFKAPIYKCNRTEQALEFFKKRNSEIAILAGEAKLSLFDYAADRDQETVYVMGNETEGVSKASRKAATRSLHIPMHNGIESLNVAVAAALVAFSEG